MRVARQRRKGLGLAAPRLLLMAPGLCLASSRPHMRSLPQFDMRWCLPLLQVQRALSPSPWSCTWWGASSSQTRCDSARSERQGDLPGWQKVGEARSHGSSGQHQPSKCASVWVAALGRLAGRRCRTPACDPLPACAARHTPSAECRRPNASVRVQQLAARSAHVGAGILQGAGLPAPDRRARLRAVRVSLERAAARGLPWVVVGAVLPGGSGGGGGLAVGGGGGGGAGCGGSGGCAHAAPSGAQAPIQAGVRWAKQGVLIRRRYDCVLQAQQTLGGARIVCSSPDGVCDVSHRTVIGLRAYSWAAAASSQCLGCLLPTAADFLIAGLPQHSRRAPASPARPPAPALLHSLTALKRPGTGQGACRHSPAVVVAQGARQNLRVDGGQGSRCVRGGVSRPRLWASGTN